MEKNPGACPLPPKELSIFKRIVKYYDQKQYKTGLKFANQILSNPKFSEHGETLSMKGILLNCLGKKEEAREFVKRGLKSNIQSFVCWHIYGLIMKSDRKYDEAIRCYIQALKLDKNNLQVLRDLSVLQMHTRDLDGCLETRSKLLTQRPNQKASWVGYATVQHLRGSLDAAATVIHEFLKVQTDVEPYNYEHSELLMYYVLLLMESKKFAEALDFLKSHSKEIVDKVSYLEAYANVLCELDQFDEAEKIVWELLERNPDGKAYYDLFYSIKSRKSKCELKVSEKRKFLEKCKDKFSFARLPKLLFFETLEGDEFVYHIDIFMRNNLRKGVPNLFIQLKRFYGSSERRSVLETIYLTYRANLDNRGTLGPIKCGKFESKQIQDETAELPSTSLWLNYLIAQHFNYTGETNRALEVVNKEIEVNPTTVDLYVLKAEIYREAGDVITASRWMDEAQSLDTADKYLNAQCTKCMVQAHRIADAEAMASNFTRGSTTAAQYLTEMQCMWFLIENARAHWAMQKYGDALKFCHEVDRAYTVILEDQLDFHSYCLRKGTLRSYIETIRLEDRLRDHPAYYDAASLAVHIYLHLHENPLGAETDGEDKLAANLSPSELKKLRNKQRKAERRAQATKEVEKKKDHQNHQRNKDKNDDPENRPPEVELLVPEKLARPENALNEAARFLQPLIELSSGRIETHCLSYEVYERKGKYLLMLRAIRRGLELPEAKDHPWFNECLCRFLVRMQELKTEEDNLVHEVLLREAQIVFGSEKLPLATEVNSGFLTRNAKSFLHVFRGTLTKAVIDPKTANETLKNLPSPSDSSFGHISWEVLLGSLELLKSYMSLKMAPVTNEMVDSLREKCSELYPLAVVFFTETDRENHLKAVLNSPLGATGDSSAKETNNDEVEAVTEKLQGMACSDPTTTPPTDTSACSNGKVPSDKMNGHLDLSANKKTSKQQKRQRKQAVETAAKI